MFDAIVIGDPNRVILKNNYGGTNYINAVYLNGYKNKNSVIATQVPLEMTLTEYWLMVSECNVKTIVWFHGKNEARIFPGFFPTASSLLDEGEMKVALLSETQLGGIIKKTVLLAEEEVKGSKQKNWCMRLDLNS